MLNVCGFVNRSFRGMNNIVRWGKEAGCFESINGVLMVHRADLKEKGPWPCGRYIYICIAGYQLLWEESKCYVCRWTVLA